jgi:hypothetical protein
MNQMVKGIVVLFSFKAYYPKKQWTKGCAERHGNAAESINWLLLKGQ